jgi:hypothetical protein
MCLAHSALMMSAAWQFVSTNCTKVISNESSASNSAMIDGLLLRLLRQECQQVIKYDSLNVGYE